MLEDIKESILNFITSRIFVLVVIFLAFFGIMMSRIFYLQIINGQNYADSFTMRIKREVSLPGTRGRIYDRNGQVLADNVLSYSVTMEDNGTYKSAREKQSTLNRTVLKVIDIVESHGDNVIGDFGIVYQNGSYTYTQEGRALLRFKADVYGYSSIDDLKPEEYVATADEMIEYLCGKKKFWIAPDLYTEEQIKEYKVPTDLTPEQILKLVTIRYAISSNSFKRYVTTTVASDVSDATVAEILENQSNLQGVDIEQSSLRTYADSKYFANIIGYIGKPDQDELDTLKEQNEDYDANDLVGKAGLEQYMETDLQGKKGQRTIYVDSVGNVLEVESETQPESGHDLYLTIDKDLQIAVYNILEQRLAGVLVSKIQNIKQYVPGAHSSAMSIVIPIYDVYYALIQNHIIDTSHFTADDATDLEKSVQQRFDTQLDDAISRIMAQLQSDSPTAYCDLPSDMKNYMSYIVSDILMGEDQVLMKSAVNTEDATYIAWAKDETISLKEYLEYAISMNWVDVSGLDVKNSYMNSEEIYQVVVDYISSKLATDSNFHTMLYKYVILNDVVTGREVCLLLYDQGILEYDEETVGKLRSGAYSAYSFMMDKIKNLEITPGQLALEPCSAGAVVTDPKTGKALACVSYPGYDNNRLSNVMDTDYYVQLSTGLSRTFYNRATQEKTAPGSTYKMMSSVAGLTEGVIGGGTYLPCTGEFDKITPSPKCWIYPSAHGSLNVVGAIQHSCNDFFYEVGYRLGQDENGNYDSSVGLEKLEKYASMFGLDETSGVEIPESDPQISDTDAVRSAIGQGTNNYTVSQLNRYVTAVANRGTVYKLSLVGKTTDADGKLIKEYEPEVVNQMDEVSSSTWDLVHNGMESMVKNSSVFSKMEIAMGGKTGTAQQSKVHPDHVLFAGYAPADDPQIAITVRIANGYSPNYAAEIGRDITKVYFDANAAKDLITGKASSLGKAGSGD